MTFQVQTLDGMTFAAIYAGSLDDELVAADRTAAEEGGPAPKVRARANRFISELLLGRFRRTEAYAWLAAHPANLYELRPLFHRNKTAQEVEIRFLHQQLARQFLQRFVAPPELSGISGDRAAA